MSIAEGPPTGGPDEVRYAVVLHSSGEQGGFVVRTMYGGWIPAPYSSTVPEAVYKREAAAQRYADKLNGGAS